MVRRVKRRGRTRELGRLQIRLGADDAFMVDGRPLIRRLLVDARRH